MSVLTRIGIGVVLIALMGVVALWLVGDTRLEEREAAIGSFAECVAAGYPVMESYPRQCATADGTLFIERVANEVLPGDPAQPEPMPHIGNNCAIAGCSSQLCVEEAIANDIMTTCEFRPEYACYASAVCERNVAGECAWRETAELRACLADSSTEMPSPEE